MRSEEEYLIQTQNKEKNHNQQEEKKGEMLASFVWVCSSQSQPITRWPVGIAQIDLASVHTRFRTTRRMPRHTACWIDRSIDR